MRKYAGLYGNRLGNRSGFESLRSLHCDFGVQKRAFAFTTAPVTHHETSSKS